MIDTARAMAVRRLVDPLKEFLHTEAAGGLVLLAATVAALGWANSPLAGAYEALWGRELTLGVGPAVITEDLRHWVNDGLITLFFFVVGLEIKRELVTGELREPRRAALPALAALGGMVVPAAVFLLLNAGGQDARGWGIPIATDTAFALGVLALLGSRVPATAKLFLLALAIVDDIFAITVVAVFYSGEVAVEWLAVALCGLAAVVTLRRFGVRAISAYVPLGLLVWGATLQSGVHATIAGVALGLLTPARPVGGRPVLEQLERRLHPVSSYLVVPVFAFANAGVLLDADALRAAVASPVARGVAVGLLVGKVVGITSASVAAVRLRVGTLPEGLSIRHVVGLAALAGIGFTVSLFVAELAYAGSGLVELAKIGILAGSLVSGMAGAALLATAGRGYPGGARPAVTGGVLSARPLRRHDGGYLPLEDHGLIGDGMTAALVGRDGSIPWLCLPRFDDPPLFCGLLDTTRGGTFTVAPERVVAAGQRYEPDTGVLVTELHGPDGVVQLTDALALRSGADLAEGAPAGRGELLRSARVLAGRVRLRVELEPRGGAAVEARAGRLRLRCADRPSLDLDLAASAPLAGLRSHVELETGDRLDLLLRWGRGGRWRNLASADELLRHTRAAWRAWAGHIAYDGPQQGLVRRSAITLKLLDHVVNGAIVAAPTSSLPEAIGGPRNWDYRYTWVRDAAFSVYALRRIGLAQEAAGFLAWVLDAIDRDGRPRVLYDLDGGTPPTETEDPCLEGYRRSGPVRWGNAAAEQRQHDVYGEVLDCAFQWTSAGGTINGRLWRRLVALVDAAAREWDTPDHGIWEVRTAGRPFTYSAALCQVTLDRGARLAARLGLGGAAAERWCRMAAHLRQVILEDAWDSDAGALTEHLGGGGLDASLLALPLRRVVDARHPRMAATTTAVAERLSAGNGLLYRYLPEESPDGLPGREGAFLLCSFWLVDNLAKQGRTDEAMALYDGLCARVSPLGLLPEQVDPTTGAFLGNYPQAFSHVGVISSGVNLARLTNG